MSNSSFMEYLYETHMNQLRKSADYIALLCHSILLDKKIKLNSGKALLPNDWNTKDPIRLVYLDENSTEIQLSVVETSGDIFITLTEAKSDGIGSMEISADDYVNLAQNLPLKDAFPQIDDFVKKFNEEVWLKTFPPPPKKTKAPETSSQPSILMDHRENPYRNPISSSLYDPMSSRLPFDYGRADLDPFGLGGMPLGGGMGLPGPSLGGGMMFDPRRNMPQGRVPYPGAPGLAGPPGARIDPAFPTPNVPGNRGRGTRQPDPDMPQPPGWEDMYL